MFVQIKIAESKIRSTYELFMLLVTIKESYKHTHTKQCPFVDHRETQ